MTSTARPVTCFGGVEVRLERVDRRAWPVLGIALCVLLAAIDVVVGGQTVLITLLVAAPLVTALGAGWRLTAAVAVLATAIAVPLGLVGDLFGDVDHVLRIVLVAIGGSLAVWMAALRERADRERARLAFLAEAGARLDSSLDYQTAARTLASLAVPVLADWCGVYTVEEGVIRQLAIAHQDPSKEKLAWELERRYPVPRGDADRRAERDPDRRARASDRDP